MKYDNINILLCLFWHTWDSLCFTEGLGVGCEVSCYVLVVWMNYCAERACYWRALVSGSVWLADESYDLKHFNS